MTRRVLKSTVYRCAEHQRGDAVNLYSKDATIAYARSLKARYAMVIIWNGLRYQIKHIAARPVLEAQGWTVVATIPAYPGKGSVQL